MDDQNTSNQRATAAEQAKESQGKNSGLHCRARMITSGQVPFPMDLPLQKQEILVREVARLRQKRLLKYIARAIAMDIHRSREKQK